MHGETHRGAGGARRRAGGYFFDERARAKTAPERRPRASEDVCAVARRVCRSETCVCAGCLPVALGPTNVHQPWPLALNFFGRDF